MKIATKERSDDCNFHDKRNYQVEAVVSFFFVNAINGIIKNKDIPIMEINVF